MVSQNIIRSVLVVLEQQVSSIESSTLLDYPNIPTTISAVSLVGTFLLKSTYLGSLYILFADYLCVVTWYW
ncbi:unnamed protein product [Penicillium roqueforti FM164]|uniref:Genomic scaffold, ProqFM164S02 n=1 Tax=Penicillium roqueforti (strain FM164) TaxID=1365484 RepID=W6QED8_PENRF|nr:unnamed protein product [Penicillium roqueforti FM164]